MLLLLLAGTLAQATDTWSTVAPGIDLLHRSTPDPQQIHVVVVDLSRPEIWLRFTQEGERGQTVSDWAGAVGATVAVMMELSSRAPRPSMPPFEYGRRGRTR